MRIVRALDRASPWDSKAGYGQQVLYLDSHVEFNKRACAGPWDDNIYTYWDGNDRARGLPPKLGSAAAGPSDSLLVNDPAVRRD
jgi:hypothetical protein